MQRILQGAQHRTASVPRADDAVENVPRGALGAIAAADFFSVEVLTSGGLVRYLVLFVIDLKTRRVHVAGVTSHAWDKVRRAPIDRANGGARSTDKDTWIEGQAHLDRGTSAWRGGMRALAWRDTRGSVHRSPLGRQGHADLVGGIRALPWRDTRGSMDPSADLDRGTSAWRRWKCGDRWIDPRTCMDTSPLGTEGHAGIDGSKCTDRSNDLRVSRDPERTGKLVRFPSP